MKRLFVRFVRIKKSGFFLAELSVSLVLSSFIMLACATVLLSLYKSVSRLDVICSSTLQTSGAVCAVMRELSRASCMTSAWKKTARDCAVWNDGQSDIGLLIVGNKLQLYRGTYDEKNKNRTPKTTSVLIENVRDLTLDYRRHDKALLGVRFSFIHDEHTIDGTVMCRNKIVLDNVMLAGVPGDAI